MSQGSSGQCVVELQRALNGQGAHLQEDGVYGSLTAQAVRNYQSSRGLAVDGIAGPRTLGSLGGNSTPPSAPKSAPAPVSAPHATAGEANPNPLPPAGTSKWSGRNDCGLLSPMGTRAETFGPYHRGEVIGTAKITTANLLCGSGSFRVLLETKVCGAFGCEWKDRDSTDWLQLPPNGSVVARRLSMPLRNGYNSYRLRVETRGFEIDIERDVPWITVKGDEFYSPVVKM